MAKEINVMEQFFIKYLKDDDMAAYGTATSLNFKTCRVSNRNFLDTVMGDKFKEVEAEFTYHTNNHNHFKAIRNPNGECACSSATLSVRADDSLTQYVVQVSNDGFNISQLHRNTDKYVYCTISNDMERALSTHCLATSIHGWCVNQ